MYANNGIGTGALRAAHIDEARVCARDLALRRLFSPANYMVPPVLSIHRPASLIRAKHT
jgi:hypothetical protein